MLSSQGFRDADHVVRDIRAGFVEIKRAELLADAYCELKAMYEVAQRDLDQVGCEANRQAERAAAYGQQIEVLHEEVKTLRLYRNVYEHTAGEVREVLNELFKLYLRPSMRELGSSSEQE